MRWLVILFISEKAEKKITQITDEKYLSDLSSFIFYSPGKIYKPFIPLYEDTFIMGIRESAKVRYTYTYITHIEHHRNPNIINVVKHTLVIFMWL